MNQPLESKSPEMKSALSELFPGYVNRVKQGRCPFCGQTVREWDFRDELSLREYHISGICQTCQDATFGKGD